jgi:putative DNA primase/helicase
MTRPPDNLAPLRDAIDADKKRLCLALGMEPDGNRFFCFDCQRAGRANHKTGDFSIASGFVCQKCGWKGDGFALIMAVKGCDFPAAVEYARDLYGMNGTDPAPAPAPKRKAARKGGKVHATIEDAARAALRTVEKATERKHTLTRTDEYKDADGHSVAAVLRFDPVEGDGKTFRPVHKVAGGWKLGDPPGKWPLFNLPDVLATCGPVYVVEGEKAACAGAAIGLTCTTSAHGSKSPAKTDWALLRGRDVVILPDHDEAGRGYAETVAALATAVGAESVRVVTLPGLSEKGDLFDFVEMRRGTAPEGIRAEIESLVDAAAPWTPAADIEEKTDKPADPIEAAKLGTPYAMTDLGNAERLVAYHGDAIRWDIARKCWRVWDGKRWAADSALRVNTLAADTARNIRKEAAAAPRGDDKNDLGLALFGWAVKSESRDRLAAMIEVAKSRPGIAIAADQFDADPWALNVANGTIDLKTGTLRPHDRAALMTKLAPVEYHPGTRCERWERFLSDATGNDAPVIRFLQSVAGYTLTGDTSEEKLFLIYGPEASGKTTFLESLRACLGEYARTIQTDLLTRQRESRGGGAASPELAALVGARLAAGSEMEQGREIAEAVAKNITGGEPITARHLYAELFDFIPQFKLWLALNHCPKVSADDGAIWRRILRIGFEHTVAPERRDKTLKPYLRDPNGGGPAVLAWAVQGCLQWQNAGLTVPPAVVTSTAAYRTESDPLAAFIEDALTFNPGAWATWADIWRTYCEHADEMGTAERYRVAPKRLQDRLKSYDCKSERRFTGRGWAGVELSAAYCDTSEGGETVHCDTNHVGHVGHDTTLQTFSSEPFREKSWEKRHKRHDRHAPTDLLPAGNSEPAPAMEGDI